MTAPAMPRPLGAISTLGAFARRVGLLMAQTIGFAIGIVRASLRPGTWRHTVRAEFVDQLHMVGVRAVASVMVVGMLVGLGLVFQAILWLEGTGQSGLVGTILVRGLVRDTAPVLVALILIGRSGVLMVTELIELRTDGQMHALAAGGIDTFELLVVPRVLALTVASFCLTVCFVAAALLSGFLAGSIAGVTNRALVIFLNDVLASMTAREYLLVAVKSPLLGFTVGTLAGITALGRLEANEPPARQVPRGFMRALLAVLVLSIALDIAL